MGSSPSKRNGGGCLGRRRASASKKGQDEIKLPGSRLRFSKDQLQRLNLHLIRLEQLGCGDDLSKERASLAVEVVVERLVQRLICGAATIDPRFASKFLTTLEGVRDRAQPGRSPRFEYLVRLDALSSPPVYPESGSQETTTCRIIEGLGGEGAPQGFAKIRVQGEGAELWAEFINSAGFLRRDKVQERFVELLAQAAARASDPARPDQVDESRLCGSPGKIIDAGILAQLLSGIPPEQQVFYGPADCNQSRFPDPRDFRIAIVESAPEVRLRVGFLSPTLQHGASDEGTERDVEVKLVLAVGCNGWPRGCDFPARAPLGHIDCLLFHRAAQTGFYVVPGPPHPAVRCDDRTVTWQVWLPAAEIALLSHYSSSSLPARVLSVLETILQQLRGRTSRQALGGFGLPLTKHQEFLKVVSRYMLRTLLWHQMEESASLAAWTTDTLSWHVVKLLDSLLVSLRTQRARSYFFPRCNIMLQAAAAATGHHQHSEDDYLGDAAVLENFLLNLHEESLSPAPITDDEDDDDAKRFRTTERLESALVRKWGSVLADLAPPATTSYQGKNVRGSTNCSWILQCCLMNGKSSSAGIFELGTVRELCAPLWPEVSSLWFLHLISSSRHPTSLHMRAVPLRFIRSQRLSFSSGASSTSATISYNSAAASQYTQRQLDYIATLLREMLRVRQLTLQHHSAPCWFEGPLQTAMKSLNHDEAVEDVVYLLSAILEQAKEQAFGEDMMIGTISRRRSAGRRTGVKQRGGSRFRSNFEAAVASLVDCMRRDLELAAANLKDDSVLVRQVLRWLYRGLDQHQRHLAPVLRPYLNHLFAASHENGWHLEEWRKREQGEDDEMRVLGTYCQLVLSEKAKPTPALMDAMTKGWTWAERAMDMAEYLVCPDATGQPRIGLQLVFAPEPGRVFRHSLAIPSAPSTPPESFSQLSAPGSRYSTFSSCKTMSTWGRNRSATSTLRGGLRGASLLPHLLSSQQPRLLVSQGLGNSGTGLRSGHTLQHPPPHCRLRDASPLTLLLDSRRRYGHQRGMGDIVHVLIALQKFSVLQEIASLLPDDERTQMLDAIQKLSKETRRAVAARRAARIGQQQSQHHTMRSVKNKRAATALPSHLLDTKLPQIYRHSPDPEGVPKDNNDALEALALKQKETIARREAELDKMKENESLLGTCRAARAQHGGLSRPGLLLGGTGTLNGSLFLEPSSSLPLDFPSTRLSSYEGLHNSKVALLHLTEDRQLRLAPRLPLERTSYLGRKRDVVTKL